MSLSYRQQDSHTIIGSKSATNVFTGATLKTRWDYSSSSTTSKVFATADFSKMVLYMQYIAGVGETLNTLEIRIDGSPDGVNFFQFPTDSTTGGVSTLVQRNWTTIQSTTDGYLKYTAQSANFAVGDVITGGTSAATAVVIADADAGTTGTLTLSNISGTFQTAETITGSPSSGSATTNGVLQSVTNIELPVDISDRFARVAFRETGVASNAGSLAVEFLISQ